MQKYSGFIGLMIILGACLLSFSHVHAGIRTVPQYSTSYELIDEVNQLRSERGLYAYSVHPILMGIAQAQAEYLASIGVSNTHVDAYGRQPFQRALDAGYAVAGDLSLRGFFSENVVGGIGLTAEGAVDIWMGDEPHQNTMLSTTLRDVGAGVAAVGTTYYYVLDVGLSTGGTPRPYIPPPYILLNTPTFATNTPQSNGAIIHIVQPGDTLLEIAIAYDISLDQLYLLNGLNETSTIYPDQEIIVRAAYTATPTQPTATSTIRPSSTPWPTTQKGIISSTFSPTTASPSFSPTKSAGQALIFILGAALLAAALLTLAGTRRKE